MPAALRRHVHEGTHWQTGGPISGNSSGWKHLHLIHHKPVHGKSHCDCAAEAAGRHSLHTMPGLFSIPDVIDNPEGWGPTTEPEHLRGIPYAPYSKADKVGRISDFAQTGFKYGGEEQLSGIPVATFLPCRNPSKPVQKQLRLSNAAES